MSEWKECTIADLGEVVGGATPSTKKPENYEKKGNDREGMLAYLYVRCYNYRHCIQPDFLKKAGI